MHEKPLAPRDVATFPKKCNNCGTVYADFGEFIEGTTNVAGSSGLKYYAFGDFGVSLFRDCKCLSTLVVSCEDRREPTEVCAIKRQLFDAVLHYLTTEQGLEEPQARTDLQNIFRAV
jgi:hypothetical protein